VIAVAEMFGALKNTPVSDALALRSLIKRNIEIKSKIVAKDERDETGERAVLNFGHTIGHALERAGDYRKFLHGEAVSLGIVAACAISIKKAGLSPAERDAIVDLLRQFNLPTQLPRAFPREKIIGALKFDKKFEAGTIRFVVTPRIGTAHLMNDVTLEDIREAIDELKSRLCETRGVSVPNISPPLFAQRSGYSGRLRSIAPTPRFRIILDQSIRHTVGIFAENAFALRAVNVTHPFVVARLNPREDVVAVHDVRLAINNRTPVNPCR